MVCLFNRLTQIHPMITFQARPVHNTRQTYHVSLIIQTCQVGGFDLNTIVRFCLGFFVDIGSG